MSEQFPRPQPSLGEALLPEEQVARPAIVSSQTTVRRPQPSPHEGGQSIPTSTKAHLEGSSTSSALSMLVPEDARMAHNKKATFAAGTADATSHYDSTRKKRSRSDSPSSEPGTSCPWTTEEAVAAGSWKRIAAPKSNMKIKTGEIALSETQAACCLNILKVRDC